MITTSVIVVVIIVAIWFLFGLRDIVRFLTRRTRTYHNDDLPAPPHDEEVR
ncbi:hypothetical protein KDL45_03615 [bacterium]|nr:hypothetical protein [bacterium]